MPSASLPAAHAAACDAGASDEAETRRRKAPKHATCAADGCTNNARQGGMCIKHGGGWRCTEPGCSSSGRGPSRRCTKHGGGALCSVHGCTRAARHRSGLCCAHGAPLSPRRTAADTDVARAAHKRTKPALDAPSTGTDLPPPAHGLVAVVVPISAAASHDGITALAPVLALPVPLAQPPADSHVPDGSAAEAAPALAGGGIEAATTATALPAAQAATCATEPSAGAGVTLHDISNSGR